MKTKADDPPPREASAKAKYIDGRSNQDQWSAQACAWRISVVRTHRRAKMHRNRGLRLHALLRKDRSGRKAPRLSGGICRKSTRRETPPEAIRECHSLRSCWG